MNHIQEEEDDGIRVEENMKCLNGRCLSFLHT